MGRTLRLRDQVQAEIAILEPILRLEFRSCSLSGPAEDDINNLEDQPATR